MLPKLPGTPRDVSGRRGKPSGVRSQVSKVSAVKGVSEQHLYPIARDEDLFRSALMGHESTEYASIVAQHSATVLSELQRANNELRNNSSRMSESTAMTGDGVAALQSTSLELVDLLGRIKAEVRTHIDMTSSEEHRRLQQLETENAMLRKDLEESREEIERKAGVIQGLRDTLARRMIRTQVENELIKQEVRDAIEAAKLDLVKMQQNLHQSIETAVLNYQKPAYASALRSLQELTEASRQEVLRQSATLHTLVDSVGAGDPMEEVKTMHSNLPPHFRKQLATFSREQLLSLIDIFSFEEGIVDCVAKALYATNPNRTQQVFT